MIASTGAGSKVQGGAPPWDFTIIHVFIFNNYEIKEYKFKQNAKLHFTQFPSFRLKMNYVFLHATFLLCVSDTNR